MYFGDDMIPTLYPFICEMIIRQSKFFSKIIQKWNPGFAGFLTEYSVINAF